MRLKGNNGASRHIEEDEKEKKGNTLNGVWKRKWRKKIYPQNVGERDERKVYCKGYTARNMRKMR